MGENIITDVRATCDVIAHDINISRTEDVLIGENVTFQSMFLSQRTLEGLIGSGFQKPSPIQLKAIPLGRCGFDLIVKSKSGTGKTIVFSVVALEMIDVSSSDLQVLILAPTREIAVQSADAIRAIGTSFPGLNVNFFIGGLPEKDDRDKARNCQIAVGAPGRIKSLIKQKILNVASVKLFVLDEADKLMEDSFQDDVNEIYHSLVLKKQIITASATYPDNLKDFLSKYMQSPTYVSAENDTQLLLGLKHFIRDVKPSNNVAQEMKLKNAELLKLLGSISFTQCIIFSNYQTRAENISISINRHGWNSMFISAAQTQEKRLEAINKLKNFKCRILLSTDLTARGIDASNIDLVINYDVPIDVSTYLHRMGRAGRYGSKGICITLVSGQKDLLQMRKFLGHIGGPKLTISKLTNIEDGINDLWTGDESKLEKVSGIIEENEDVTDTIKNEILSLKKSSLVTEGSTAQTEKRDDYEQITNYLSKSTNKKNTNKKTDETMNMNNQEIDMDVANSNKRNNLMEEGFSKNNTCLQSLANGTFNFDRVSIPDNIDSFEDDVSKNTCLLSLANGTFDFGKIPSPKRIFGNIDEFPTVNDTIVQAINEVENQFMKSSSMENEKCQSLPQISLYREESSSENDTVSGCEKKNARTRKSSELEVENEGKICKNEIYIKNKGIYEVARILNSQAKPDSDTELNLNNYLNSLENFTTNDASKQTNECITGPNPNPVKDEDAVGNIFNQAYLYAVEFHRNHWKCILKDDEVQPVNKHEDNCIDADPMEEDHEEDYMEDCEGHYQEQEDDDYQREASDEEMLDVEEEYDEHGYINIPNRMVWVPVEENTCEKNKESLPINLLETNEPTSENIVEVTINRPQTTARSSQNESSATPINNFQYSENFRTDDHFSQCFHEYSKVLWEQGLNFNSTEEFDVWYHNQWLAQVKKIREYVRQNVYVRELSRYQNMKKKF